MNSNRLERAFPNLVDTYYQVDSPQDKGYNCIAWAAGDKDKNWWPDWHPLAHSYWPDGVPKNETLEAFKQAYAELGYNECQSREREEGYEKIAIFTDNQGTPTHAARQLQSGLWTSKCGDWEDITHELEGLEGSSYGTVACVMKRPVEPE